MDKPFLPSDIRKPDLLKLWRQCAAALVMTRIRGLPAEIVVRELWGGQPAIAEAIIKAGTAPAATGGWGGALAGASVGEYLRSLAPVSAAARLFAECHRESLVGANTTALPRPAASYPQPLWVGEGQPIPALHGAFESAILGPQRKLAAISGLTHELATYSAEDATEIIGMAMSDAAAKTLDAAVFSATAADAVGTAGLLYGVTPIASATMSSDGGRADAMVDDLSNLAGAIGNAGGGSGILYFANPRQATAIELRAPDFASKVVPTSRLVDGTIVAIETGGIASAFDGLPQIDVANAATIHYENATPAQIGTADSPNVAAAPTVSTFQTAGLALRLVLRCAWTVRMPGAVQVVTGANW